MGAPDVCVAITAMAVIGLFFAFRVAKPSSVLEPIRMPKFPKVADIARPILRPVNEVKTQVTKLPKKITDVQRVVGKQIKEVERQVGKKIQMVEGKLVAGFNTVFSWIRRAVSFVLFFPQCFLWYMLHVAGYMLYAPVAFFVWVFRLQAVERLVFEYIERADRIVHGATGVHPFHFSNEIQARCYFSPSKLRDLREERRRKAAAGGGGGLFSDPAVDDSETVGYAMAGLLLLCLGSLLCILMAAPAASSPPPMAPIPLASAPTQPPIDLV